METRLGKMNVKRFVADANIFILLSNDRLAGPLPQGEFSRSGITEMELLSFPSITSSEEAMIRDMLSNVVIYGIDQDVKEEAIRLRRRSGLELPDAIIAATAICHQAVLLTNDAELQNALGLQSQSLATKSDR